MNNFDHDIYKMVHAKKGYDWGLILTVIATIVLAYCLGFVHGLESVQGAL